MIAYINGKLTYKSPTDVIIEASNGVGYQIHISLYTYNQIANLEETKLLTTFIVKEDSHTLYGFADKDEQNLFGHLISVSGVGPSTARILLSTLSTQDIRTAIIAENINILKSAKGIGPKAAKRIVLELKDKILKDGGVESEVIAQTLTNNNTTSPIREEALSALIALGFNRIQVQKALNEILKTTTGVKTSSDLIKLALSKLSS